jgi:hypothetical protein
MHLYWLVIVFLIAIGLRIVRLYRTKNLSLLGALFVLIALAAGASFVYHPESSNILATSLGIGRGVDAAFFLAILLLLTTSFKLYLKSEKLDRDLTALTIQVSQALHQSRKR